MLKLIQGHRGTNEYYPENTILSFDKAFEQGANAIELDVRKSLDGVHVVMHDITVDRTTDGTGNVRDLTWAELSALDAGSWKGAEFTGLRIPRIEEVLRRYQKQPVFIVIHINFYEFPANTDMEALVDLVESYGMLNQVHFSAYYTRLNYIKAYNSLCFTQSDSMYDITTYEPVLQNAIDYGLDSVSINASETLENLIVMVNTIHNAGKIAHASYLSTDYPVNMQKLIDAGVDYVLGDNVASMMAVFAEPQISPNNLWAKKEGVWVQPINVFAKYGTDWIEPLSINNLR